MSEDIQAVNESVEQTTAEQSPSSEDTGVDQAQNTDLSKEPTSGDGDIEDAGSENLDEDVEEALQEVKSEKGINRVHQLAQRARAMQQQAQSLEGTSQYVDQQYRTQQYQGGLNIEQELRYLKDKELIREQREALRAEQEAFNEVIKQYPEIAEDPELDNAVYAKYVAARNIGQRVDLNALAQETVTWYNRVRGKAYEEAESGIAQKEQRSERPARTTQVYTEGASEAGKAYQKFLQTRDQDDYMRYLSLQNKG